MLNLSDIIGKVSFIACVQFLILEIRITYPQVQMWGSTFRTASLDKVT